MDAQASRVPDNAFGIEPFALAALRALCETFPGLLRVWIFGSRARDDWRPRSDIDLSIDAPDWSRDDFARFDDAIKRLPMVYSVDMVHWQKVTTAAFRERIERDRKVFWEPRRHPAATDAIGSTQLKPFQASTLLQLDKYLAELVKHRTQADRMAEALRVQQLDVPEELADFPRKAWSALKNGNGLPPAFAQQP